MNILLFLGTFLVGLLSSFVGTIAGGGAALISVPFLTFLGLPPNVAIATNRFGTLGMSTAGSYRFYKGKKIIFKHILVLSILSVVGGLIGVNILLNVNEALLSKIVGICILFMLPVIFLNQEFGSKQKLVSLSSKIVAYISYFLVAIYDGFFGGGAGLISVFLLVSLLGLTYLEANATNGVPWFFNVIISTVIFVISGLINYTLGIFLLLGMLIGGYLGAHLAIKKGNKFVRLAFCVVIILSAFKLII